MDRIETTSVDLPFADALARRILDAHGGLPSRLLVLLPSTRAARGLRHAVLEASGREAVLLPVVATPGELLVELGERMDLDLAPFPSELRAEWLAHDLAEQDWLAERPESAPGLAAEMVALFDEMRRHGLDPSAPGRGLDESLLLDDVERVTSAWSLYRQRIPCDEIDAELAVLEGLDMAGEWPGRPFDAVWAAGFVAMPPTRVRLLEHLGAQAGESVLLFPPIDGQPAPATFAGSYADPTKPTHPDAPARLIAARTGHDDEMPAARIPCSPPVLSPAGTAEDESERIVARIIETLRDSPAQRICVATNDRDLARRVVAQLGDAGLDLDDSSGVPLSSTPAGRLAWLLLRCAVTGPAYEPLLELAAHPLVTCGGSRKRHKKRTLSFERELLRRNTPPADMDGYLQRARDRDAALNEKRDKKSHELTEFVADIARVLDPVLELAAAGPQPIAAVAEALRASWELATEGAPRPDGADDANQAPPGADEVALDRMLETLASASASGPDLGPSDAAALLSRLMNRAEVRPHRSEFLPLQVTGLLEARLEHYDLLILGGLTEDVFPGRLGRPLFLGRAWREAAGLPDWREMMGRQAELFQRLLRAGDRVVLSWPSERDGQPVLASPFVQRLLLGLDEKPRRGADAPLYRDAAKDLRRPSGLVRLNDPAAAPVAHAPLRHIEHLSPSALSRYLQCPYRWLLEKGYGLAESDTIREALESREQGSIVHECMAAWLAPEGAGVQALSEGRTSDARDLLIGIAADRFAELAGGLPQRPLWEATFLRLADPLIAFEQKRIAQWRPAAVETEFSVPLGSLRDWLGAGPELTDQEAAVDLFGRIDRVDLRRDGTAGVLVLDYKTGTAPSDKDVKLGRDLQLACYALAVVLNGVSGVGCGIDDVQGAFHILKSTKLGFKAPVPMTAEMLRRDALTVLEAARAMLRADGPFPLAEGFIENEEPEACRYCHLAGVCRREERRTVVRREAAK